MGPKLKREVANEGQFACPQCSKWFNNKQNLIRHERRNHRLKNFQCYHCPYNTKFKFQLRKHITNIHINTDRRKTYCRRNKIPFKCSLCEDFECNARADMLKHYAEEHKVPMEEQIFDFVNINEFMEWKERTEFQECFKFTLASKHSDRKTNTSYYRCFRDGHYVPKGKGKRRLKLKGTNKTNSVCPCSVRLIRPSHKESCQAIYISQHVGHSIEVSRLTLTKQEKSTIAEKLSAQVPFNSILDSIRESLTTSDYKRIHLTTFKDLHNIRKSFGLDDGPRRSKATDSEHRIKSSKGNRKIPKAKNSSQQEDGVPVEVVRDSWQTQVPTNENRDDTYIGSWSEPQITIKTPANLLCGSLPGNLHSGEDGWPERPPIAKLAADSCMITSEVPNSWQEEQTTDKDDRTVDFNKTAHRTDVVSLAWQGAQMIGKETCNAKNDVELRSNVEESWHEAQVITDDANAKSSLENQPQIAVGWPEMEHHRQTVPSKDALHIDQPQRPDIEDSWHGLDASNDDSDVHHSNDAPAVYSSNDLSMQKQEIGNIFASLLESVRTPEELEVLKKSIVPISNTLAAMRRVAGSNQDKSTLVPWWSKPY